MTISLEQALAAKNQLKHDLKSCEWFNGIGVGADSSGDHVVEVRARIDSPDVRAAVPSTIDGVVVRLVITGQVRAQ